MRICLCSLVWAVAVSLAVVGAGYTSLSTWHRYRRSPTVTSLERDYQQWNTSFPALTLCPSNRTNDAAVTSFINQRFKTPVDTEDLTRFIHHLVESSYRTFDSVPKYELISPIKYVDLILNVSFKLTFEAITSNLHGFKNRMEWMTMTLSELGVCYTFNSKIAKYNEPRDTSGYHVLYDLERSLVGNPLDGDVFAQIINMNSGGMIYLHSDSELPDVASKGESFPSLHFKILVVTAVTIFSTREIASLSISQRQCRFLHESELLINPIYTYNLCRMDCRMRLSYRLCRCTPHFYWALDHKKYKICGVKGMECLARNKERLVTLREKGGRKPNDCQCLPTCDETNYLIETDSTMEWFMGTNLKWGIVKFPRIRFKRDILFGLSDVLVAIGGSAGLFLGCSVLSFVEILWWCGMVVFQSVKQYLYRNKPSQPFIDYLN